MINTIRKEDTDRHLLANLDYSEHLWMEREIKSVANAALLELKERRIRGAKVLKIEGA